MLMIVTVFPETVHIALVVEENVIASPELAEAVTLKGAKPSVTFPRVPKEIVCDARLTVKVRVIGEAAE
jgi:hypothetical protein